MLPPVSRKTSVPRMTSDTRVIAATRNFAQLTRLSDGTPELYRDASPRQAPGNAGYNNSVYPHKRADGEGYGRNWFSGTVGNWDPGAGAVWRQEAARDGQRHRRGDQRLQKLSKGRRRTGSSRASAAGSAQSDRSRPCREGVTP